MPLTPVKNSLPPLCPSCVSSLSPTACTVRRWSLSFFIALGVALLGTSWVPSFPLAFTTPVRILGSFLTGVASLALLVSEVLARRSVLSKNGQPAESFQATRSLSAQLPHNPPPHSFALQGGKDKRNNWYLVSTQIEEEERWEGWLGVRAVVANTTPYPICKNPQFMKWREMIPIDSTDKDFWYHLPVAVSKEGETYYLQFTDDPSSPEKNVQFPIDFNTKCHVDVTSENLTSLKMQIQQALSATKT